MKRQHSSALTLILALAAGPVWAQSADDDWDGFYIGAFAAASFFDVSFADFTDNLTNDAPRVNEILPVGGVNFGYNWLPRRDNLLLGVELELQGGHETKAIVRFNEAGTSGLRFENTINSITSLRGRVGMVSDDFLIYLSGGPTWAEIDYSTALINAAFAPDCAAAGVICADIKEQVVGITYGVGMEYKFRERTTLRVELTQLDLPTQAAEVLNGAITPVCAGAGANDCTGFYSTDIQQIQIGVNYRF